MVDTPWNPATIATLPPASASRMRSPLTSMIFARLCSVSVTIPACEPVNDIAGTPRSHRHAHERHRDALAGGQQHVELAAVGVLGDVVGEPQEIVGGLAHRRHDDHDVVAAAAGARDVIGYGSDPVGIGNRGAAEFLDEKHGQQGYRRPLYRHEGIRIPGTFCAYAQRRQTSP